MFIHITTSFNRNTLGICWRAGDNQQWANLAAKKLGPAVHSSYETSWMQPRGTVWSEMLIHSMLILITVNGGEEFLLVGAHCALISRVFYTCVFQCWVKLTASVEMWAGLRHIWCIFVDNLIFERNNTVRSKMLQNGGELAWLPPPSVRHVWFNHFIYCTHALHPVQDLPP